SIEVPNPTDAETPVTTLREDVRKVFELTPEIAVLEAGTLEKELMSQVKQQRFIDKRG
ncbi:MAG: hypothetical protein ACI9MU_002236, partial [Alphaproteobacteria bacterium]